MSTTLISSIGRGQKGVAGSTTTYDRTAYVVDGIEQAPTPFFVHAWLQSASARAVDRVHLVGTATSTWSALVEEYRSDDLALWDRLEQGCGEPTGPGVTTADLAPLAAILSARWGRPVTCQVLCHREIDDQSSDAVLGQLLELFPLKEPQRHLIIDTTHAPRTLPLLALSAVQLADALRPGFAARVQLIYGERLLRDQPGRGISLDQVLEHQRLADALRVFCDGYDASDLARYLQPVHPELSQAITALGDALLCNAFEALGDQVRRTLRALEVPPAQPAAWWTLVQAALRRWLKPLDTPHLPRRLLAVADLHCERRQFALALLTMAEAAATLACPQRVDDHETMRDHMRAYGDALPSKQLREDWFYLQFRRNAVAHGANRSDSGGPTVSGAGSIAARARAGLLRLIQNHH